MDPVSMILKTEELVAWAKKLLGPNQDASGGRIDPDEFEKFRVASLDFVGLLFDSGHSRCQTLVGQAGRGSRDAVREDLSLLQAIHTELRYFRDLGH